MFKIQVLGNPEISLPYVTNALKEEAEDRGDYLEWFKEISVLENTCDLEIDVMSNMFSADFDEIIPMVDGIIYFINPLNEDELEFFEIVYPIINSVKRDIPTIILFYDPNGIIPVSNLTLLKVIWYNFPEIEAFVNTLPRDFHQVVQCLNMAMIVGDSPLNIETSWLRLPIYMEQANNYFKQRQYFYAAQAMRKVSLIAEIFNREEYFIYCEQTAYLFSRSSLYLEASKILKKIDKKKSKNYKKLYAEAMINEGNKLFNKKAFETAARQYETAAQWASIELKDKNIIFEAFSLAINSWISACKCSSAFSILERLPHDRISPILRDVANKVIGAADYLSSIGNLEAARDQLYIAINTYQREGMFSILEKFTGKLVEVLVEIFKKHIKYENSYSAKNTYDEIENMWETFNVPKVNLDSLLEKLIRQFVKEMNFGMVSTLINKLTSLEMKTKLTEFASDWEDKQTESRKKEVQENIQAGVKIISKYMAAERDLIMELNNQVLEQAYEQIALEEYLKAAEMIKNQSNFLNAIGKEEISNEVLTKSLDILLKGGLIKEFFSFYGLLTKEKAKSYIKNIYPVFYEKLEDLSEHVKDFETNKDIFNMANKIYRNHMLYEESKAISEMLINLLKLEALDVVKKEESVSGINEATELIKQINNISSSYLDGKSISFDDIYKNIAEIYISMEDLSSAQAYNDRIENKQFKSLLHKKIGTLEAKKSAAKVKMAEDSLKGEILKEKLSIIKKKSRDASHDKQDDLKQRMAFKRAYFKDALLELKNKNFLKAIEKYKESAIRINRTRKYNLAAVSLAIGCFLLIKENKIADANKLLNEVKRDLSASGKLFSETFPIVLMEYILEIKKLNDEPKIKEAMSYLENLPLFDLETELLYDFLGKKFEEKEEKEIEAEPVSLAKVAKIRSELNQIAKDIIYEKQDLVKRKMMKRQYWDIAIRKLENKDLIGASIDYLDATKKLIVKNFNKHASIGLIVGILILNQEKGTEIAKKTLEKNLKENPEIKEFAEIKLLEYLLFAYENNVKSLIELCFEHLLDKINLFEVEAEFLKESFSGKKAKPEETTGSTRKQRADLSKLTLRLDQTHAMLQQKMRDVRSESKEIFTKRKAMYRRYYQEIMDLIEKNSFEEAAEKYLSLAKTFSRRKDMKMAGMLLLFYGLSLIKKETPLDKIRKNILDFLESLGMNKQSCADTYHVQLFNFILDVILNKQDQFIPRIRNLLNILPIFEEEKILLDIV